MEKIYLIITNARNGLSKKLDVTEYSFRDFTKTVLIYSNNFDVRVKRYFNA